MDQRKWQKSSLFSILESYMLTPPHKISVLFVCLGNICRSPAAEGSFKKLVKDENINEYFIIDSAGTSGYHDGELADIRTRMVAKKRGIILDHKSRKFIPDDFKHFDYILAMDNSNHETILKIAPNIEQREKVFLFRNFENINARLPVPDPYYENEQFFETVQDIVENASKAFLNFLKQKYKFLDKVNAE